MIKTYEFKTTISVEIEDKVDQEREAFFAYDEEFLKAFLKDKEALKSYYKYMCMDRLCQDGVGNDEVEEIIGVETNLYKLILEVSATCRPEVASYYKQIYSGEEDRNFKIKTTACESRAYVIERLGKIKFVKGSFKEIKNKKKGISKA